MRINISKRLTLSFLAILILEMAVIGSAIVNMRRISEINREAIKAMGSMETVYELLQSFVALPNPLNNYLRGGNPVEKEVFKINEGKVEKYVGRIKTFFIEKKHARFLEIINKSFQRVSLSANDIFSIENPVGNPEAFILFSEMNAVNEKAVEAIEEYHEDYFDKELEGLKSRSSKVVSESLYLFLVFSFLSLGLSFVLAYFLSRRIYDPIFALEAACKRLAAGNMDERVEIDTHDELEGLAAAFNRMVVDLKKMTVSRDFLSREIEERMQIEEDLRKSHEELVSAQSQLIQAEKMETVGRLASGVAHEVKNPLAIILQGLEYFSLRFKAEQDENITLTLQYMQDAVRRADGIIRGMLDFSLSSKLYLDWEDLNSVVEASLVLLKFNFDKSHIKLIKELSRDIPKVNIDKNKIQQAFINFFINAIDSMPNGGLLTVRTYGAKGQEEGKAVIVEIEDSGDGIPDEDMEKIYEPFYTTKRAKGGTGLGLSITRNIIEMHSAGMKIENRTEAKGVKVTVVFKV